MPFPATDGVQKLGTRQASRPPALGILQRNSGARSGVTSHLQRGRDKGTALPETLAVLSGPSAVVGISQLGRSSLPAPASSFPYVSSLNHPNSTTAFKCPFHLFFAYSILFPGKIVLQSFRHKKGKVLPHHDVLRCDAFLPRGVLCTLCNAHQSSFALAMILPACDWGCRV